MVKNVVLYVTETITLGKHKAKQLEDLRKILEPKRGDERLEQRSKNKLYWN